VSYRTLPLWKAQNTHAWPALRRSNVTKIALAQVRDNSTPIQLLQFALRGTVRSPEKTETDVKLDENISGIFSTPYIRRPPKSTDVFSLPTTENPSIPEILEAVENGVQSEHTAAQLLHALPDLRRQLARNHHRVPYEEILAAVDAIYARVKYLGVEPNLELVQLGLLYASICCSFAALKFYISQFSEGGFGYLSSKDDGTVAIIRHLLHSVRYRLHENPSLQAQNMWDIVIGSDVTKEVNENTKAVRRRKWPSWKAQENESRVAAGVKPVALDSLIEVSGDTIGERAVIDYITLLGSIGATKRLSEIWVIIDALRSRPNCKKIQRTLQFWVHAVINAGEPQKAVEAVQSVSSFCKTNDCISTGLWKLLLEHDSSHALRYVVKNQTVKWILRNELQVIEAHLGTAWVRTLDGSRHLTAHDTISLPADLGLEEADIYNQLGIGSAEGHHIAQRLMSLITTDGSSRSISKLSVIAELLNEYEGAEIRLDSGGRFQEQFAWFPHCSPIEFVGKEVPAGRDSSVPWTPASLGLIHAREDCNGVPLMSGSDIHLMQLGYIGVRPSEDDSAAWACTGHVICWDRLRDSLLLLFVGKGHGTISPGRFQPALPTTLPYAAAEVDILQSNSLFGLSINNIGIYTPWSGTNAYWLDVDTGSDLSP
jgi:hypothetical protein